MKNTGNKYDWQGMLIVTILMIMGLAMFVVSIIVAKEEKNLSILLNPTSIAGVFFFGVGIYSWVYYKNNVTVKPQKEILYLLKKEKDKCTFIDKEGKRYFWDSKNIEPDNFYTVSKTKNNIYKVVKKSSEGFELPELKENYWLNLYTPVGNYENVFALPIIYVIFLILIIQCFNSFLINIIPTIGLILLIGYDLIYKYKKRNLQYSKDVVDDRNLQKTFYDIVKLVKIITSLILNVGMIIVLILVDDIFGKIAFIPFVLCALSILGTNISDFFNSEKYIKIFNKLNIFSFMLYILGFLLVFFILLLLEKEYFILIFFIPFSVIVIYWLFSKK